MWVLVYNCTSKERKWWNHNGHKFTVYEFFSTFKNKKKIFMRKGRDLYKNYLKFHTERDIFKNLKLGILAETKLGRYSRIKLLCGPTRVPSGGGRGLWPKLRHLRDVFLVNFQWNRSKGLWVEDEFVIYNTPLQKQIKINHHGQPKRAEHQ